MQDFTPSEKDEQYRIPGTNSYLIPPEVIEKQEQLSSRVTYGGDREKDLNDSHIIYSTVTVGGEEILKQSHFSLSIHSQISTHDRFEILCPSEEFDETHEYPLTNSRNALGKRCTIQFKQYGKSTYVFTGIITGIENRRIDGYSHVALIGSSPTFLLDSGENCRTFENQDLSEIVSRIVQAYPTDRIQTTLKPHLQEKLPYIVQYNQSDWEFLQSLSSRYGENLIYNGDRIVLGGWGGKTVELFEEQDFFEYRLQMKLVPQHFQYTGYEYSQGESINEESGKHLLQESKNPFQQFAQDTSEKTLGVRTHKHYPGSFSEKDSRELARAVKKKQLENKNVTFLEMKSHNPHLKLGDIVKIHAWMPGHKIFKNGNVPLESYKIIKISHEYKDRDGYYNQFTAIPKDTEVAPVQEIPQTVCEAQPAVVTDNKDPQGLGRIRVHFPWQSTNEQSPWIRQVQPHAGSGKGFYFIPELNEEVWVDFENHDPERPFIIGTQYNGKDSSGYYTPGNDWKVIQTRSGTKILLNDAQGSIRIKDPSGNNWFMDGQGNISINAPKNFSVHAGEDIILNAGKNMYSTVGKNKTTNVAGSYFINTGIDYIVSSANISLKALKKYFSKSENHKNIASNIQSQANEGNLSFNAQQKIKNDSGEKNNLF